MKTLLNGKNKKVKFEFTSEPGSKVSVAGSFNNWDPAANPLKNGARKGIYTATISLPMGRHEYRFVVNDVWCADPNCQETVTNGFGSRNSVLTV